MAWTVEFHDAFVVEFSAFSSTVQDEVFALAVLLTQLGPQLARPYADTLKNSRFSNMKELRFSADDGEWRVAFAFDTGEWRYCCVPATRAVSRRNYSTRP